VVPENVDAEVKNSAAYFAKYHHCIFCALIDEALTFEATIYDRNSGAVRRKINVGQYVVERGEKFIAIKGGGCWTGIASITGRGRRRFCGIRPECGTRLRARRCTSTATASDRGARSTRTNGERGPRR
jgi:hypothetical protein